MKKYRVSFKLTPHAWLNREVEAETEKDAKASAKEFFVNTLGKERVEGVYKNKANVVCEEINEPINKEDYQEV